MQTYVVLRRAERDSLEELAAARARWAAVDERLSDDIAWIRSYVLAENDGSVGEVCICQAATPEAIRGHSARAGLEVDEIVKVADTIVVRPDPAAVAA
jgi:Protein of unknown function (DUF4242)